MPPSRASASLLFLLALPLSACGGGSGAALPPAQASAPLAAAAPETIGTATARSASGLMTSDAQSVSPPIMAGTSTYRAIDAGGASSGSWSSDTGFTGGWTAVVSQGIDTSHVSNPAPQAVYQSQRVGASFTYTVQNLTPRASYDVRLHFAEIWFDSTGQRRFNATLNGATILSNFDILAAAGGKNVAIVKTFTTAADSNGSIGLSFSATLNNAAVNGVEVAAAGSSTPAPSPSTAPVPSGDHLYSSSFTGHTPFHHTVSALMTAGAHVLSSTIADHYWAEGLGSNQPATQGGGGGPLYTASSGDPAYVFHCPTYGECNASGRVVHFPNGAHAQTGSDHHLNSFDPVYLHGEVDGWGGDGNPDHACNLDGGSPGAATCSWGGFYPFSGSGLATQGNSGDAGGYAFGLMNVTAQELLQGHIDHALGIAQSCLDDNGVYPSIPGRNSDAHCPGNLEPNARYGDLIHVKSSVNVDSLGYSPYCRVIVEALQKYGAYTADTNGSWGISLNLESLSTYGSTNPWYSTIFPSMVAGSDGWGSDSGFGFHSCLNRLSASDIEVIEISPNLPPA